MVSKRALFCLFAVFAVCFGSPIPSQAAGCTMHVAPDGVLASNLGSDGVAVSSLQEAAEKISQHDASDAVICVAPGIHRLKQPLQLNSTHNHPHGGSVTWRAADPTTPPLISAGAQLTNWYRCDDGVHCPWPNWHGVWVHMVSDIPNMPADMLPVRQLWVNGSAAPRNYVAPSGWTPTGTGYTTTEATSWSTADQVELRWPSQVKNWIEPRCLITEAVTTNITVDPDCWAALTSRNGGNLPPAPLFAENVPEPPSPGSFYANSVYIFYRPSAEHEYSTPADAWVPTMSSVMQGDGLQNHNFTQLTFKHATWREASMKGGYVPSQSLVSAQGEPVGAVNITHSTGVRFDHCTFENIGAAYALSVGGASQGIRITNSTFTDCSGGAVKLGNVDDTRAITTDPTQFDVDMLLENNLMQGIATEFRGAATVFAGYVAQTTIAQNTIRNTGYTGISLGWGWGSHVTGPQTFARDNHITGNFLEGVMSALNDGGCTYTLGPQPDSTVSGNVCKQDRAPVVGCFYHDNGSRYFKTFNNVADTSPAPCVYLQGCCNSPAYDIAVSNLWCRSTAEVRNGCAAQNCTIDAASLFVLSANAPWPAAAQAIIDAAGATIQG